MLNARSFLSCICFILIGAAGVGAQERNTHQAIPLTRDGSSSSVIVYPRDCALSARTAKKLSDYVQEHTGVRVPVILEDNFKHPARNETVIVLDATSGHRLVKKLGQTIHISSDRNDAYHLQALRPKNASPLVIASGKTAHGVKYAVYRLMRELEIADGTARIKPQDVQAEPFIKTRSIALFNVWGMPIELTRRHNTESWSVEELEHYLDMYDFFGFNAIESHDRFNDNYLEPLFGLKRVEWREKVQAMCDHAHVNGQQFFLRIWGHTVMETPKLTRELGSNSSVPRTVAHLCVNDPAERKRWEEEILNYYVENYAGRIDNLIGHWCDPGVCRQNGCDLKTPLKLQMELHRAFKAVDPEFTSSFSLWYFDVTKNNPAGWARGGWAGYEDDRDLINAGILDKDVIIATATMQPNSYKDDIVKAILDSGHKPAVWTWYRADHEIRPSLHIHMHERLGDYFKGLPGSARQLEWHSMERNVHAAANTANYYVAGRLMWDPSLNVDDLLKEFLTLAFGADNAAKIIPAYLAIESIRCHSCYKNLGGARVTGMGTANPKSDFENARAALGRLSEVKIDPNFRPRIPLDVSPAQIIADLAGSLEVIRDFASCRANELPAVEKAIEQGDIETARKLLDALHAKYGTWILTLAGRQEWSVLDSQIKEKRKQFGTASNR